jgi:hypothetical protein|tara:strand:+ start:411 stop:605 length:195 start_codon:yes stop_codon:yes gene_type:complete
MTVSQETFNAYIQILDEHTETQVDILNVLNDIARGDWDNAVNYSLENPSDPMDDFNYAGSKHHY